MYSHKQCRKCSAATGEDLVMLWDGHVYCSSCLDAAQPALADYARHHPVLSEELPERIKSQMPTFWTVFFYFLRLRSRWTVVLIVFLFFLSYQSSLKSALLFGGLMFALSISGTFTLVYFFNRFYTRPKAEKVTLSVTEGIIEIRRDERIVSFPLTSSYWADYSDRITEDLPFASVFRDETFLLVYDKRFRGAILKSAISMCGFAEESRERWLAFLKLAGIPVH